MLETKCDGDNCKMLGTVSAILVNNIHYLSNFCHQHPSRQHQDVTNITVTYIISPELEFSQEKNSKKSKSFVTVKNGRK